MASFYLGKASAPMTEGAFLGRVLKAVSIGLFRFHYKGLGCLAKPQENLKSDTRKDLLAGTGVQGKWEGFLCARLLPFPASTCPEKVVEKI